MKAEISQSMLKWSSEDEINTFCAKICSLFNPKYVGNQQEKDALMEIDFATAYSFSKNCELTADEMELAFHLATEGKLKSEIDKDGNATPIQLYREVDAIKLGELKSAYIRYKRDDVGYGLGKEKIKAFLAPPEKEHTPEEQKDNRKAWFTSEFERLQKGESVLGSTHFFDLITANEEIKMNVADVAVALGKFNPEKALGKNGEGLPIVKKNDVVTYFKDKLVASYIKKHNLKELSLEEFINYWEKFVK